MEWVKRMDKELRAPPENQPLQKCIFQHKVKIALTSEIKTTPLWTDQVERLEWRFEDAIKELSSKIDAMGKRKSPGNSPDRKPRKRNKEMADIDLTKEDLHLEEEKTGNIRMEQHMYLQTEDNLSNNKYHSIILTILLQQHWL